MQQRASWFLITLLTSAAVLQPGGCAGPIESGTDGSNIDKALLEEALEHVRDEVMNPELAKMQADVDQLDVALVAWAAAPTNAAAHEDARASFVIAMEQWGVLDALQVGPSASSLSPQQDGADLRDAIYSWPAVNPCRIDQETVYDTYQSPSFFEVQRVNVYGLDALEQLLYAGPDNACPGQVDINGEGTWANLGADGITQARADYAVAVVGQLGLDVQALQDAWSGAYGDAFVAGDGVFNGREDVLSDLFLAAFYIELMKDEKLAYPLGLRECGAATCPELAESQGAGLSGPLLSANLVGMRSVLAPVDGVGFVDLLEDAGESELADSVRDALNTAEAASDQVSSVAQQVDSEPGAVQALYDAVAALAGLLEGDVSTVLNLEVPSEAAGDAD